MKGKNAAAGYTATVLVFQSTIYFEALSSLATPFLCYSCVHSKYESEIDEMKESLAVMARRVSALCMDTRVSTTVSVKTVELSIRTLEQRLQERMEKSTFVQFLDEGIGSVLGTHGERSGRAEVGVGKGGRRGGREGTKGVS